MSEHAWRCVEWLGHWALAWTLVVAGVAAWLTIARPSRVALRYAGWLWATFAGAVLAPMVLAVGPLLSWRDALDLIQPASAAPARSSARFVSWFEGYAAVAHHDVPEAPRVREGQQPTPLPPFEGGRPAPLAREDLSTQEDRWLAIAMMAWAAGSSGFAARLIWAAVRVRALVAESTASVPPEREDEMQSIRRALGLRRPVRLAVHPGIRAPMCVGLLRPVILLPTEENCPMTPGQRRASLAHELAHLSHLDDWVGLLAELWRSASWFYPPVHWTLGRLYLEREARCDEIASRHLEGPECYARWLLDLAPITVRPPVLASSLLGGTDLAARIRRLLDGRPRPTHPMTRLRRGLLAVLAVSLLATAGSVRLIGFAARAGETESPDAPLPEITREALAERIVESRKRYEAGRIEVEFEEERGPSPPFPTAKPDENITFPGRFQYASDGRRWRAEYDSKMPSNALGRLIADRWSSGFDGIRHYTWSIRENHVTFGESNLSARLLKPVELLWHESERLLEMLGDPETKVGQRTVDGIRCYVVERTKTVSDVRWRNEYLIAPRRSHLAVGLTYEREGRRYFAHRLFDLREAEPGLWVPGRIVSGNEPDRDGKFGTLDLRRSMRIVRHEPSRTFAEEDFRLKVPLNTDVTDFALGTSFCNDPWWPEIGKLLRDRFDWPKIDPWPLRDPQTYGDPPIVGRPAPPIEAASWVYSEPLDWQTLRGKVVLVDFTALGVRNKLIPGFRKLLETYGPAGFEVISVLSPRDAADDVRQWIRELNVTHRVAIDRPHDKGYGKTRTAFGMESEVSTFLVDREGIVHKIAPEGLIEELVRLLRGPNAAAVEPISLETAEFSDEMRRAVEQSWKSWVAQAPATGRILGTLADADGHPIAGARIVASLETRILTFSNSHFLLYARTHRADSGPDGSFTVPGLCKGNYALRITAPGFAVVDRPALIDLDVKDTSIRVVLSQSDTISGRVVDHAGRPVGGAETILSDRRLMHADGTQTNFNGFLEGKTTDADGRFRFGGLSEGDFTLKVKGEGLTELKWEHVPAGSRNLEVIVRRAEPR